jgi:hypothetical protein
MRKAPEWKTFDTLYALDSFAKSWAENEKLIKLGADDEEKRHRPKWSPENEDEEREYLMELQNARHLHDEILTPMFRYSWLVMLYTIVERELRRLISNVEKDRGKQKLNVNDIRGDYLHQVTKYMQAFVNIDIGSCDHYESICDLQKIRNCIVHCRGELDLFNKKDREYLVTLRQRRKGFSAFAGTDLEIGAECIDELIREIWHFFITLFQQIDWKIDDSWAGKWTFRDS